MFDKTELNKYLAGIAIGIHYRANFKIQDKLGYIVDDLLYDDKSYFDSKKFPLVENSTNGKVLTNLKSTDKLAIKNTAVILQLGFNDGFKGESERVIMKNFYKSIVKNVLVDLNIFDIRRIGYIREYLITDEKIINSLLDKFSYINGKKIEQFDYTMRYDTTDKNKDEFNKYIIKFMMQEELKHLFISVDYQLFYEPNLKYARQIVYNKFIESAIKFNEVDFISHFFNEKTK
jgi:hypothetical protein